MKWVFSGKGIPFLVFQLLNFQYFLITLCLITLGCPSLSFGQTAQINGEIQHKIETLKIKVQYQIDSIKLITKSQICQIKQTYQISADSINLHAEYDFAQLQMESENELTFLTQQFEQSVIKQVLFKKYYLRKYNELEMEFKLRYENLERDYLTKTNAMNSSTGNQLALVESKGKSELDQMELKYKKELALLELEINE